MPVLGKKGADEGDLVVGQQVAVGFVDAGLFRDGV